MIGRDGPDAIGWIQSARPFLVSGPTGGPRRNQAASFWGIFGSPGAPRRTAFSASGTSAVELGSQKKTASSGSPRLDTRTPHPVDPSPSGPQTERCLRSGVRPSPGRHAPNVHLRFPAITAIPLPLKTVRHRHSASFSNIPLGCSADVARPVPNEASGICNSSGVAGTRRLTPRLFIIHCG